MSGVIHLKKHRDEDGSEYIWASDIFGMMDEFDPKAQKAFEFLLLVEKVLNYFQNNTSTAFGNPDLALAEGKVAGYCMAKGWEWMERDGEVRIMKGDRTLFRIEKPALSRHEIENRKEVARLRNELGF